MDFLQNLEREKLLMLYNLLPDGIGEKYGGSYILKINDPKNSNLKPSPSKQQTMKPTKSSFRKTRTYGRGERSPVAVKIVTSPTDKTDKVKSKGPAPGDSDEDRAALLLATGRIGKPIGFNVNDFPTIGLYDRGCVTCGKENIETKFHGMRHVCPNCRNYIKTYTNDKAFVYLSEEGEIICKGMKVMKGFDGSAEKKMYDVAPDELKIFEYRCFATLSGPDELVILLHHEQNIPREKVVINTDRTD